MPSFLRRLMMLATDTRLFLKRHPLLTGLLLAIVYLVFFQRSVVVTGDAWAEGYVEFVTKLLSPYWRTVVAPSWEGYMTFLPCLLGKLFIAFGGPLGYIDFYYRCIVILFAVGSSIFVAAPIHRSIIKNDSLRIALALGMLIVLNHVTLFSFINIWYICFFPIIFLSLNPQKLETWQEWVYAIFGVCAALTKPSTILLPFLVYRAYKTKAYLSNGLIAVAALYQTYLLFYQYPGGQRTVMTDVWDILQSFYIGGASVLLKLLQIPPSTPLILVGANLFILGIFLVVLRYRGFVVANLLLFGYLFSIYTYAFGSGTDFSAWALYTNIYKAQRELPINLFILLSFVLACSGFLQAASRSKLHLFWSRLFLFLFILIGLRIYHPVSTTSSDVYVDIGAFRHSLTSGQTVCMPIAPTPKWFPPYPGWVFQHGVGCVPTHTDKTPDFHRADISLATPVTLEVPGLEMRALKSLMILTHDTRKDSYHVYLKDVQSGIVFEALVKPDLHDPLRFVAFNLAGFPPRETYRFELSSDSPTAKTSLFLGTNEVVSYPYFGAFSAH